jgi:hypothetical protein
MLTSLRVHKESSLTLLRRLTFKGLLISAIKLVMHMAVNYKGENMCKACGCGKKKGEPGFGKGKSIKATMKSRVAPNRKNTRGASRGR